MRARSSHGSSYSPGYIKKITIRKKKHHQAEEQNSIIFEEREDEEEEKETAHTNQCGVSLRRRTRANPEASVTREFSFVSNGDLAFLPRPNGSAAQKS